MSIRFVFQLLIFLCIYWHDLQLFFQARSRKKKTKHCVLMKHRMKSVIGTEIICLLLPELSNYCRNLDDKEMPWCFTSETEWGYCDVSCKWMPGKIGSHQSSILMTSLLGSSFLSTKHAACQSTKVLVTNLVHVSWALEFIYTTGPTKTDPSQTCKKSIKGAEYLGTTAVTQWEFCLVFLSKQENPWN